MDKFFAFLDKYRKWIMLVGFALIVGFLCTGHKYGVIFLSKAGFKSYTMFFNGELDGITPIKTFHLILSLTLLIAFFATSVISIIVTFCGKKFFFSIPLGIITFDMYILYIGQTLPALYYRIPLTLAFIACLTLELLSKYRHKLIKKAQPTAEPIEDKSVD